MKKAFLILFIIARYFLGIIFVLGGLYFTLAGTGGGLGNTSLIMTIVFIVGIMLIISAHYDVIMYKDRANNSFNRNKALRIIARTINVILLLFLILYIVSAIVFVLIPII